MYEEGKAKYLGVYDRPELAALAVAKYRAGERGEVHASKPLAPAAPAASAAGAAGAAPRKEPAGVGGGSGDESSSEDESVPVASLVAAALRQPAKRPHPGKPADAAKPTGVADTATTTPAPAAKPLPAPARPVDAAKPTKEPTAAAAKPGARAKSKSSSAGGASRKRQARGGTTQRQAPLSDLEQELDDELSSLLASEGAAGFLQLKGQPTVRYPSAVS